jgi:hypothetical protein
MIHRVIFPPPALPNACHALSRDRLVAGRQREILIPFVTIAKYGKIHWEILKSI